MTERARAFVSPGTMFLCLLLFTAFFFSLGSCYRMAVAMLVYLATHITWDVCIHQVCIPWKIFFNLFILKEEQQDFHNCHKISGSRCHTACLILQITFLTMWINVQLWKDMLLWFSYTSLCEEESGGCSGLALCFSLLEWVFETKLSSGEHVLVLNQHYTSVLHGCCCDHLCAPGLLLNVNTDVYIPLSLQDWASVARRRSGASCKLQAELL